jgi:hypothetical protein
MTGIWPGVASDLLLYLPMLGMVISAMVTSIGRRKIRPKGLPQDPVSHSVRAIPGWHVGAIYRLDLQRLKSLKRRIKAGIRGCPVLMI